LAIGSVAIGLSVPILFGKIRHGKNAEFTAKSPLKAFYNICCCDSYCAKLIYEASNLFLLEIGISSGLKQKQLSRLHCCSGRSTMLMSLPGPACFLDIVKALDL
jgi:hypothetical protein